MSLADLAIDNPEALAALLADPATPTRVLSWGAECLGARWTPDRWWPTIIRCGEESRVASGLVLRFDYDATDGGRLEIMAVDVPAALRAAPMSVARVETTALPDAVTVGAFRDYAGLDLSGAMVLAATCADSGPVTFRVVPVKRSDVETFLRHQAEGAQGDEQGRLVSGTYANALPSVPISLNAIRAASEQIAAMPRVVPDITVARDIWEPCAPGCRSPPRRP